MAVRRSYTEVKKTAEPKSFAGKYGLGRTAGMKEVGDTCFVIPLDLVNGYATIPTHSVRKNDSTGFGGSTFDNVKILCKSYDPVTGERLEEDALCCKLARIEMDRKPDKENSAYRCLSFKNERVIIPLLVLATTETDSKRKPSIKKISLKGIEFSYIEMAETSYQKEFVSIILDKLASDGKIDDVENMEQEERLVHVLDALKKTVVKITNVDSNNSCKYIRKYTFINAAQPNVAELSEEHKEVNYLIKLINDEIPAEKLDALYGKYPVLKEINNQITDYLSMFNTEVDSLALDWSEEELQKYYDGFIKRQTQTDKYKDVNAKAASADEDDEVYPETDEDVKFDEDEYVEGDVVQENAPEGDVDFDDEFSEPAPKEAKKSPAKKEADYNYDTADLESPNLKMDDEDFSEDDFNIDDDEDDFE